MRSLPLIEPAIASISPAPGPRALEDYDFPFEALSDIAEAESWRKEINRPLCHLHKWWARRLGTVFRSIVIGTFAPAGDDVLDLFYKPVRIDDAVVFDPFMGSGTTIGEICKTGARAIGRDINPVAHFLVRIALATHDRKAILSTYSEIERDVAEKIRQYYRTDLPDGKSADALYYFWVKVASCPNCHASVDLFPSRIFARHHNPSKSHSSRSVCPTCGSINLVGSDSKRVYCDTCKSTYNPQVGNARGKNATCPNCRHVFAIAKTIRETNVPPKHRLYAKLVLMPDGSKAYMAIDSQDIRLYDDAVSALGKIDNAYPVAKIKPGYNTDQVLNYNYRHWHEMFNDRQLLCLSILTTRIQSIQDNQLRELFACLLSGTLEFYNMFASYKGEGTGAVRHMFAHHILKPERVPLEANLWGTPKSSGAFSKLFESRVLRALDYAEEPFEIRPAKLTGIRRNQKIHGLSQQIGFSIAEDYAAFLNGDNVYLSCGDSGKTDLPDGVVDAVITDPPFFDNVHYSQLADFFYVWQRHMLFGNASHESVSTRSELEVQNAQVEKFTERLAVVWCEMNRVLKCDGLLVFTYHHSRPEGWSAMLKALLKADFIITATHPIKSEMSVAIPKHQAKEPINLDVVIVCRKRSNLVRHGDEDDFWGAVSLTATDQVVRFRASNRQLSRGDIRVIVMAQLICHISKFSAINEVLRLINVYSHQVESLVCELQADDTQIQHQASRG